LWSACVLEAGMWNKDLQRTTDRRMCKIHVPEDMQVVLLGRTGAERLLGSSGQVVLDKILKARNHPKLSQLSILAVPRRGVIAARCADSGQPLKVLTPAVGLDLRSFLRDEALPGEICRWREGSALAGDQAGGDHRGGAGEVGHHR